MNYDITFFDGKISWNLSKVGIPEYDENTLDYNKHFEWIDTRKFYQLQVSMFDVDRKYTPDAIELFWSNLDPENIGKIICQMQSENNFFSLLLVYDHDGTLVDYQEGRHRIVACLILGIEKVPVWKYIKNN